MQYNLIDWFKSFVPAPLNVARAHPQWSSLNPGARLEEAERAEQVERLRNDFSMQPAG